MYTFLIESVVQGYHEYKDIWYAAIDGLELLVKGSQAIHTIRQP